MKDFSPWKVTKCNTERLVYSAQCQQWAVVQPDQLFRVVYLKWRLAGRKNDPLFARTESRPENNICIYINSAHT